MFAVPLFVLMQEAACHLNLNLRQYTPIKQIWKIYLLHTEEQSFLEIIIGHLRIIVMMYLVIFTICILCLEVMMLVVGLETLNQFELF